MNNDTEFGEIGCEPTEEAHLPDDWRTVIRQINAQIKDSNIFDISDDEFFEHITVDFFSRHNVLLRDIPGGNTLAFIAISHQENPKYFLQQLNKFGANLNSLEYLSDEYPGGITPLMYAVVSKISSKAVNALIDLGADIAQENDLGFTAIDLAERMNHRGRKLFYEEYFLSLEEKTELTKILDTLRFERKLRERKKVGY